MLALLFFVGTISPCLCKPVICRFAGFMPAYYYILRYIRQSHSRTISFCEYRNFFSDEDFFLWIVLNLSVKPNRRIADFIFIEIFMFVVGLFRCISVVRGCFLRRPCLFRWLPAASRWLEAVAMPSAGAAVLSEYVKSMLLEIFSSENLEGSAGLRTFALAFGNEFPPRPGRPGAWMQSPGGASKKKFLKNLQVSKILSTFATFFAEPRKGVPGIEH